MELNIIPKPVSVQKKSGVFNLSSQTKIVLSSDKLLNIGQYLQSLLSIPTGYAFPIEIRSEDHKLINTILINLDEVELPIPYEGYRLEIDKQGVRITASSIPGAFYALQTLRQLLPPEIENHELCVQNWQLSCIEINDSPRFSWRGLHLDVGRHFFPVEFVKRYIDLLAMHKMNMFHWHLTEDQGWRIEIKKYPKLTQVGSWRTATPIPSNPQQLDGKPYGGFYTQEEIRDVVQYAHDRFVTVVPEIEMPGHSVAALASYPELGCTGGPYSVRTFWGIEDDVYCAGNEQVFTFLQDVLDEILDLFPGQFIHIGGDECPKIRWETCPKCQDRINREGLKDEYELQSYFIRHIERYLGERGRRLIGWDEILEGGLAPGAAVMSWRGVDGGIQAAKAGHDVVMSPFSHCYFDYYQSEITEKEPPAIGGYLPLERVYEYEPVPDELSSSEGKFILGAQGNVWTEYIPDPQLVEYMAYPRACALAEVVWTPKNLKDIADFNLRLHAHLERLQKIGVNYRDPF